MVVEVLEHTQCINGPDELTKSQPGVLPQGLFGLRHGSLLVLPCILLVVFSCLLLFILIPGSIVACKSARPGQFLYPIKRILEEGEIFLTKSQEEKNKLQYKLAEKRVEELEQTILSDP